MNTSAKSYSSLSNRASASANRTKNLVIYISVAAAVVAIFSTGVYLVTPNSKQGYEARFETGLQTLKAATGWQNGDHARQVSPNRRHGRQVELAMQAYSAGNLVRPAGANSLEHYLAALQSSPADSGVREAVLELVPVAMTALESAMATVVANDADRLAEVDRLFALLERADPSAARLTALKRRWQASQVVPTGLASMILTGAPAMSASATPRQLLSEVPSAKVPSLALELQNTATPTPETNASKIIDAPAARRLASLVPAQPRVAEAAAANAKQRETLPTLDERSASRVVEARPINTSRVNFPKQARRQKIEGWVDLEVRVDANGRVTAASVIGAQPQKIFDIEARRAVMRWRFSPKLVDDQPVPSVLRQRIKFSLNS